MRDRKLEEAARDRLGPDGVILGAFVGHQGPTQGTEAFVLLVLFPFLIGGVSRVFLGVVFALWIAGVHLARRFHTVVVAESEVILLANSRWHHRRPSRIVRRLPRRGNLTADASRSTRVRVGGDAYLWVTGRDLDEARRLSQIAA